MAKHKTHYEDCDVLVVGGGMAGTGATFEARHWGRDKKIICVEKANIVPSIVNTLRYSMSPIHSSVSSLYMMRVLLPYSTT